jgi:hypothetical protein
MNTAIPAAAKKLSNAPVPAAWIMPGAMANTETAGVIPERVINSNSKALALRSNDFNSVGII